MTKANLDVVESILWLFYVDRDLQKEYAEKYKDRSDRTRIAQRLLEKSNRIALEVQKECVLKGWEIERAPVCISYEILSKPNPITP